MRSLTFLWSKHTRTRVVPFITSNFDPAAGKKSILPARGKVDRKLKLSVRNITICRLSDVLAPSSRACCALHCRGKDKVTGLSQCDTIFRCLCTFRVGAERPVIGRGPKSSLGKRRNSFLRQIPYCTISNKWKPPRDDPHWRHWRSYPVNQYLLVHGRVSCY